MYALQHFFCITHNHHDDSVVCLGIAWTLYNLATHPEHQEKCRQEVDAIFSEKEDEYDEDITRYLLQSSNAQW